jgi:DNA repair protein RadC
VLIDEFGSLPLLLAARPGRQLRAAGDPRIVALLQTVKQALRDVTRADLDRRPVLPNSRALRDYLMVHLADEANEHVRILYLNAYDRLIIDELHASGTPSGTPFCIRTIAARALEVGAMSVIVAHNHPSGLRESSRADIAQTIALEAALDALGIVLIDHLIVTRGGLASVRAATQGMAA